MGIENMKFRKNDLVTLKIEDIGSEGEGIGKAEGFTLFVKDAVVGDTVEARIVKNKKNYAYARLEKVIIPSPFRVEPKCAYHRQCGGCQLQALSYERQLIYKQEKIKNNLIRIGGFAPEYVESRMEPIVGMDEPFRYRNKAQYPVGTDREGNLIAGFYAGRTHSIIASTDCFLGPEVNAEILECILKYMKENRVSAYDETTGKGLVRHILIRRGFSSGEIMVCLVINWRAEEYRKMTKMSENGSGGDSRKTVAIVNTVDSGEIVDAENAEDVGETVGAADPEDAKETVGVASAIDAGNRTAVVSHGKAAGNRATGVSAQFLPMQDELLDKLSRIEGMTSVSVSINTERTNVIMGQEIHTLWGRDTISDTIHVRDMGRQGYPLTGKALTFGISPLSFYQVNPLQTEKLYSLALEYAGLTGKETVWDLYCGIGTISLFLAGSAGKVYGVEVVPQAIADARENALRNGIENAEFFVGKAEEVLKEFYTGGRQEGSKKEPEECMEEGSEKEPEECPEEEPEKAISGLERPDVIVVDPPRKGCDGECLKAMIAAEPKRIVYVSCDPATLARDLRVLCDGGYELERIRGVDQFGMTVHTETVCLLSNTQSKKKKSYITLDVEMADYYRIKNEGKNSTT